jgi:1-acyl-sn-glycerol-3-phosphate acyltransferase
MEVFFLAVFRFFKTRRTFLFLGVFALLAAVAYTASRITLEEDISRMISGVGPGNSVGDVVEHSPFLNKIVVTVSSPDLSSDELISVADSLALRLSTGECADYVESITYKISDTVMPALFNIVYDHLPIFLNQDDYRHLDSLMTPSHLQVSLDQAMNNLLSPASFAMKELVLRDPLGMGSAALGRLGSYQNDTTYTLLNGCIFSADRKNLMMFITPRYTAKETSRNIRFVKELDALIVQQNEMHNGAIHIQYFGAAVVAAGNAERLKKDIRLTLSITLILLGLIIGFSLKTKKLFPFILLPAIFGGLVAMAVLFLLKGKVSVISLSIGSVILAITVDYALHITTHFKHKHSIIDTIKDVSFPIMVCGFATAFEFLTLVFVSSESLHELGILAAISVVTAAFFTLVVMPHILEVTHRSADVAEEKNYLERFLDKVTLYHFHRNKLLLLCMAIVTATSLFFMNRVGFETDMMKMNYMSDQLRAAEEKLNAINNTQLHSLYVVAYGKDIQQALAGNERVMKEALALKSKGQIQSFSSPGSLLMSDSLQANMISQWNNFWSGGKMKRFLNDFEESAIARGFRPGAFRNFEAQIQKDYKISDTSLFQSLQKIFLIDNLNSTPEMSTLLTVLKVENSLTETVKASFHGMKGVIVIDRKSMLSRLVNTLGDDFNFIANISLLLILSVLIIAFGRIELGVITFVPIFLSWVWTLGFMGFFGIRFNIFNIIISSFITGLGIDYSIYIMQGLVQDFRTRNVNLLSYKTCILISVMISLSGTGVLILARHPALHSIALISIIGLISVVLISYTLELVFFYYLVQKRGKPRLLPVTASDLLMTLLVFSIFVIGCVWMNLMWFVTLLLPLRAKHKRLVLHIAMMLWCRIPVYSMWHIRKTILNPHGEDFSKPAIILSNHQSHIDLLLLLLLHPKLIVLTTKWVWNNPLYALVIRYLNYYSVTGGYENLIDKLQMKVDEGYSVIIFPEGSRSADQSIKRFHKGAFLLAEALHLDLIPVFIHGAGDCMNKGENHLRGGTITVKIMPRILASDVSFGDDYHKRTKMLQKFYRTEFARIRAELETPAYFRRRVIRNYIYKGPLVEWYTRVKLSLEGNYRLVNTFVPRKATVVDIGCGYGYMSYMLGFVSKDRQILGLDYDTDKIELAANCISRTHNIRFICANAVEYRYESSDVFILSDVLHYIPYEQQQTLLNTCVEKLNPGGRIIIRDADANQKRRHRRTRFTEMYSTGTGFNRSDYHRLFFFESNIICDFANSHNLHFERITDSRLTSNVLYILTKVLS